MVSTCLSTFSFMPIVVVCVSVFRVCFFLSRCVYMSQLNRFVFVNGQKQLILQISPINIEFEMN